MRDIEADERARQARQAELALQFVDGIGGTLVGFEGGEFELFQQMLCVLVGKVDERAAGSALRNTDPRSIERRFQRFPVLEVEWHKEIGCPGFRDPIPLGETGTEHRTVLFVFSMLYEAVVARQQFPASDTHDDDTRVLGVACVPHDIAITAFDFEDHRWLFHLLEMAQGVAKFPGALEVEALRCVEHPLPHVSYDIAGPPFEEPHDLVDHRPIVFGGLKAHTRRLAALDEVIETGSFRRLLRQVVVTGPDAEDPLDHIQRATHRTYIRVWTEVPGAIVL